MIIFDYSILLVITLLSDWFNCQISDIFAILNINIGHWLNKWFGLFVIYNIFILFALNYVFFVVFKKNIISIITYIYTFLCISFLTAFILCIM